jgi:flotillin
MTTEVLVMSALAALALVLLLGFLARLYRKVGPNMALIVYGAGGIKVVRGGGTVVWPMIQNSRELSLELMSFDVAPQKELYTNQGVGVLIEAVTQLKVRSDNESIRTAAEQFLDKAQGDREGMIRLVMEGHLRGIVGQLTIEQLVKEPEMVADKVRSTCAEDLNKMGLEAVSFTIKEVRDQNDYIANMGRPDVARIQRDANIATAEAQRDTEIRLAQAQREAAVARALADQERVIAETASVARQAEAQRDLEIKKAQYVESVQRQKAQADKSYEIQTAVMEQQVTAEKVKVQLIEREAQVKVQEAEIRRREKELQATTLKSAEIEAQRIQVIAEAEKRRVELEADAMATKAMKEGQARIDVDVIAGEAQAKVTRLTGEAEAQIIRAKGDAEAEAMRKKASAYLGYNEAALVDKVLAGLPDVVRAVTAPLAAIDRITVVSTGGGTDGNGHANGTGVDRITQDAVRVVAQVPALIEGLTGLKVSDLVNAVPRLRALVPSAAPAGGADSGDVEEVKSIPASPPPPPQSSSSTSSPRATSPKPPTTPLR